MNIPNTIWKPCKLCGKSIQELAKIYGGNGIYYINVFKQHLKIDHSASAEDYFEKYHTRPLCACGVCGQKTELAIKGSVFKWKKYRCGRYPETLEWSEKAKNTRKGAGNPMYQQTPWNQGLTKDTSPSVMQTSVKLLGIKPSDETRKKQSESAKKRLIHGHTGKRHSEETKQRLREITLNNIKKGVFKQLKSKPHKMMTDILTKADIKFKEEVTESYWSFDFKIENAIYIEVDGDYFHSNPKFYPNGPVSKTQKVNWARDINKNKYCKTQKIELLRFWENDILTRPEWVLEQILCKLKK